MICYDSDTSRVFIYCIMRMQEREGGTRIHKKISL